MLALDESDREWPRADIAIDAGVIRAIGHEAAASRRFDRVIEAEGLLAMPGLINGHFHSSGNLMKGCLPGLPLEIFMLYEVPPLAASGDEARLAYVRTLLGAMEMLARGITAVHDDAYHVPIARREVIDAIMEAYRDAGIRATLAIDQPNVVEYEKFPFLAEILPPAERRAMEAAPRQSAEELLELYAHLIERWHGAANGRLRAAVSCSAPQRVTPEYFAALSGLSKRHDLPFNVHMLETRLQRVLGEAKYGKSLVRHVHDSGWLDERMTVIHAIWIDEHDAALLARSGCTVAHNPVCNLRLGSGIMPYALLKAAAVPICLGSDEMNTDDTTNMWLVAKTAALLQTLGSAEYRDWPAAPEVLGAVTRGGARAMRLAGRVGQLAPGFAADIVLLDLDTAAFTPLNDLRRQLVFAEDGSSVRYTIVDGRVVYENGALTTVDARAIRAEARTLMERYRATLARVTEEAKRLEPYYREMYLKAAALDVGLRRQLH